MSVCSSTADGSRSEVSWARHLGQRPLRVDALRELVGLLPQALGELLRLGQVADRAVRAGEDAVTLAADGVHLGRDRISRRGGGA